MILRERRERRVLQDTIHTGDKDLVRGLYEIRIPKFCLDNGKLFEQLQVRSELQEAAPSWSILLRNLL